MSQGIAELWQELGISAGTAIVVLIALYFVIKWAVKNGILEACKKIEEKKAKNELKEDTVRRVWDDLPAVQPPSAGDGKHCGYRRHSQPGKTDPGNLHAGNPGNEYGFY